MEEMKLAELKYPINQEFGAEKYSKYIEQMTQKLGEPFSTGDEIVKIMEDRWRKLENVDIDDDKDVMYYRAHVSVKDMYAERIFERM